jgi:hypothetical protein
VSFFLGEDAVTDTPEPDANDPKAFHWSPQGIRAPKPGESAPGAAPAGHAAPPPSGAEQRLYPRIDLKLPVLYKIMAEEPVVASTALQPYLPSKSDNISVKGVGLVLAEKLTKGTILALSIHMTEEKQKISAIARVVWSQPTDISHHFLTGLEFIVVYKKTRSATEYVDSSVMQKLLHPPR